MGIIESRARAVDLMTHNYYELLYAFHIYRHNYRKGKQLKLTVTLSVNLISLIMFYKNIVFDLCNFYLLPLDKCSLQALGEIMFKGNISFIF